MKSLHLYGTAVDDDGIQALTAAEELEEVHISSDQITDKSMTVLCALPRLVSLLLDGVPGVTNAGIAELRQTNNMRELYLNGTQLDDDGVEAILHLPEVWSLCVEETKITDSSVARFGVFKNLRNLSLDNTQVTGHGLSALSVPRLNLYMDGSPVRDENLLAGLRNLSTIETLSLSDTLVTDACINHICRIPGLYDLRLNNTAVTDEGMALLIGHPTLAALYIKGTNVTETCAKRLKDQAPRQLSLYH